METCTHKSFVILYCKYGASAASTYWGARCHGFSIASSLKVMHMQVLELGKEYLGGLECTKYRGKERLTKLLSI